MHHPKYDALMKFNIINLLYLSGVWEITQNVQEVSLDKRELCLYKLILLSYVKSG